MKKVFFILLAFLSYPAFMKAEKLKNSAWEIVRVECKAVANEPAQQRNVNNQVENLRKKSIVPVDQYVYEFTADELVRKSKGKVSRWNYKEADNNIVVDMGKGVVLIQKYEIIKDTLILEMDKELFFLSEFGAKAENIKSLVKDISLKYYYKQKK